MTNGRPRARELGIRMGLLAPGPLNAITDVAGVRVGHTTLIEGEGSLVVGRGPIRTGVTVVLPPDDASPRALVAGCHSLNGNGEMTGLEWVRESGLLTTPVAITNTHSVGTVRDALIQAQRRGFGAGNDRPAGRQPAAGAQWSLPVVGETWDGLLNDIDGQHVRPEHVFAALAGARAGPVEEGCVGGGTGMICHELKGGIGTASRVTDARLGGHTVGVLVQANYGRRERLTVAGLPLGVHLPVTEVPSPWRKAPAPEPPPAAASAGAGSIIVVLATDAPLLAHQCRALAERAGLGIARVGGAGERTSGDLFLAFATGNRVDIDHDPMRTHDLRAIGDAPLSELFWAAIEATEEAIVNALVAAETMVGRDGITAHALPHAVLRELFGSRTVRQAWS